MATLKEWLESPKKDYGIGLALLTTYSKNRIMLQGLSRKQNPDKLEYELRKIATSEKEPASTASLPSTPLGSGNEASISAPVTAVGELVETVEGNAEQDQVADDVATGKTKVIRSGIALNYDDLSKEMQARWDQNRDNYKEIRALHEKLKLMEKATPEDRQPLTQRICDLDDVIKDNWVMIDAFVIEPASTGSASDPIVIDHKRIQSNRKYISTNLKKLPEQKDLVKIAKIAAELQLRYDELKAAKETVSQETIDELIKVGVQC